MSAPQTAEGWKELAAKVEYETALDKQQSVLTKRELFAVFAMQGFITGLYAGNNAGFTVQGTCVAAVEYADALILELENAE